MVRGARARVTAAKASVLNAVALGRWALLLAMLPLAAFGQAPSPAGTDSVEQRLQRLEQRQQELEDELKRKDAEIEQLKSTSAQPPAVNPVVASPPAAAPSGAASQDASSAAQTPAAAAAALRRAVRAVAAGEDMPEGGWGAPPPKTSWGTYTPNRGFKLAETDSGDVSLSIYTYARYLNQKDLEGSYVNAFGNTVAVQRRNDIQLQKVQFKLLGWLLDPNFRYFLYAWSSNTSQGQGAQVVLAGNLNYTFNKYFTFSAGITSLPGVRSTEGNFPFWLSVDNRLMADEFFRPSYTSGVWARGDITDTLRYQVMLGNNMSTLGVSAAQLDNHLDTTSAALVWEPQKNYGIAFGDFDPHQNLSTRFGGHFTHSTESKQSQPNQDGFENTQIRLSDGTVVFTPGIFGPNTVVDQLQVFIEDVDFGFKYRGWALEGEYYVRQLNDFQGAGVSSIPQINNHGYALWLSGMVMPKFLQLYVGTSKVYGDYGNQVDARIGMNMFPYNNKVLRWNTQVLYLDRAPTGGTAYTYPVGAKGFVFNTDVELAL
jgi:hypothetical protein